MNYIDIVFLVSFIMIHLFVICFWIDAYIKWWNKK